MSSTQEPIYRLIAISILLVVLDLLGLLNPIKSISDIIIVPVKRMVFTTYGTSIRTIDIMSHYQSINKTVEELLTLTTENKKLQESVRLLTKENESLRKQLGSPMPPSYQFVPASVIAFSDHMEIWAGAKQGIKKGMAVVMGNVLLGQINEVSEQRSSVILTIDDASSVPIKTSRGSTGVAQGYFGKELKLDRILQKDPLFLGDTILTTGANNFPPNLLIGAVAYITSDEVSSYKQAKLTPAYDKERLETVFVITSTL